MNGGPSKGLILRLALLDLRHEWILTLCMVLAMAAILAPLLILLGLKHGTVETLRTRLVQDPVNREIRPARTLQLDEAWFKAWAQRPEVAFIIPTILRGSSVARASTPDGAKSLSLDLIPSAAGDPLLLENQGVIPAEGECVLSYAAALELQVSQDTVLELEITRTRAGQREAVKIPLRVAALLSPRADALPRLYAPAALVNDVETYRAGQAVPTRGWDGGQAVPYLSYDGVWILTPQALNGVESRSLTVNTGLAELRTPDPAVFKAELGLSLPEGYSAYQLLSKAQPVQPGSFKALREKLRGKSAILLPFAQNLALKTLDGQPLPLLALSLSAEERAVLNLPELPWGGFEAEADFAKLGQILWAGPPVGAEVRVRAASLGAELSFPLQLRGQSFSDKAIIPVELAGVLRTAHDRAVSFDPLRQSFLLGQSEYRGFRLYARSIDDVPSLYRDLSAQNIEVLTQVQEIEKVQILDRGLTRLFWLVAVVGVVGGMASLLASLYAAVERKKRDISVLRLMGMARLAVFRFPIYQGVSIALWGVLLAFAIYALLAWVINLAFAVELQSGQKICTLPALYFGLTVAVGTGVALFSALLAAWKTTRIDPAEALREE